MRIIRDNKCNQCIFFRDEAVSFSLLRNDRHLIVRCFPPLLDLTTFISKAAPLGVPSRLWKSR